MKTVGGALILFLLTGAGVALADDVESVYRIGEAIKNTGAATGYEVQGYGRNLDIHLSSMLPSDARKVAKDVCGYTQQTIKFDKPWTARFFLVVGDRPAATCKL